MEIGIDCEEIESFKDIEGTFLEKIFTPVEVSYCLDKPDPAQHFAARFAAKEAVMKAVSTFDIRLHPIDIGVVNQSSGRPIISCPKLNKYKIKLSLSHSGPIAMAAAIVEEK